MVPEINHRGTTACHRSRLDERRRAAGFTLDERDRWVFGAAPISWRRWVVTWELDQLGGFSKHHVLENVFLLPS